MLQRCPSRRDAIRCEGCGIQSVCRHWPEGKATAWEKEKEKEPNPKKAPNQRPARDPGRKLGRALT
jgi:hypothetical protein